MLWVFLLFSRPCKFIKNRHLSCALLCTRTNTGLTGKLFWPLEASVKNRSHWEHFLRYYQLVTCVLKMWPDFALICHIAALRLCHVAALMFFCLSSGLSNELSLSAHSKSSSIERDNEAPFPLSSKSWPLVGIHYPLFPTRRSKGNQAEKCLNELLYIND